MKQTGIFTNRMPLALAVPYWADDCDKTAPSTRARLSIFDLRQSLHAQVPIVRSACYWSELGMTAADIDGDGVAADKHLSGLEKARRPEALTITPLPHRYWASSSARPWRVAIGPWLELSCGPHNSPRPWRRVPRVIWWWTLIPTLSYSAPDIASRR